MSDGFSNSPSLIELFRQEAESQCAVFDSGLLALERDPKNAAQLEALMRAAHSLKGAARIVGLDAAERVAHAMEDCFVTAQRGGILLGPESADRLLKTADLLRRIAQTPEAEAPLWNTTRRAEVDEAVAALAAMTAGAPLPPVSEPPRLEPLPQEAEPKREENAEAASRVLRVTAASLNRLLGMAGEALVESRWLAPYAESILRLKRDQWRLLRAIEELRETLPDPGEAGSERLAAAQQLCAGLMANLSDRHAELELYVRRSANLSHRLYGEALASRMRPFADGATGFPRLVRDLARTLGKEVRLEITGGATPVDRDVLEQLEAPLTHLIRNAVDHGMETAAAREEAGKPREGLVRLEARHVAGLLQVTVEDDGRGIPLSTVREAVLAKRLTTPEVADQLSEEEWLDFLFLPGFSMREEVTEISGRGVGLDVVRTRLKTVGGTVRIATLPGYGTRFTLQLPLTLSVLRALLVEIAGEPYGLPLTRIDAVLSTPRTAIETVEGREHIAHGGRRIGLVAASQLLGKAAAPAGEEVPVVVLSGRTGSFGVAVDRLLGERQLVVQPLDPRLGKVRDISSGALMPDGSPLLMVDVDDLLQSIDSLVTGGSLGRLQHAGASAAAEQRKRVLVVDDSLTVRELERKLLSGAGYEVEAAVDGMDGWNTVRADAFDLVITDIDMPRLDGIELVKLIKSDARTRSTPVIVVSYKDRAEDRQRGLEAGADYYLTKGSFHDETLLQAVTDLIGPALPQES